MDRDDLPDYGAAAFVGVIRQIRRQAPGCKIEVLTPDFRGAEMPLAKVIAERPDVFNHNVEVVPRLYPVARRGSRFERSCRVLRNAKEMGGDEVVTKSGLMVGLGESFEEMIETFGALREHGVEVLTVGQYLRPTERHLPVVRYWHPDEFAALERAAYEIGFESVAAGPARAVELSRGRARAAGAPGRGPRSPLWQGRPLARPGSPGRPGPVFPLKDNIPTERFPVITVALIAINVFVFLFLQHPSGFSSVDNETVAKYGAIPYELTHPGKSCGLGDRVTATGKLITSENGTVACEGTTVDTAEGRPRSARSPAASHRPG